MDVLDLDWSFVNLSMLASASVDNMIHIWNCCPANPVGDTGHRGPSTVATLPTHTRSILPPFKVLGGHISYVKGVSFDPIGRYLASAGGDNMVIIWDCDSWEPLHLLDGPLKNSLDRTIFRRLSWAPDGGSLCVTAAMKSSKPVGMVLKRGSWESVADLVGHESPSVCCKFCPTVLTSYSESVADVVGFTGNREMTSSSPSCCVVLGDQEGLVGGLIVKCLKYFNICDFTSSTIAWNR